MIVKFTLVGRSPIDLGIFFENTHKTDVSLNIRNSTQVGRVLVSDKTLTTLEAQLNRKLNKRWLGRPKKTTE
jgi:hypothetical protein